MLRSIQIRNFSQAALLLVPKRGLEPPHPCEYMDLNHARLPIPPFRHTSCVHNTASRGFGSHELLQDCRHRPAVSNGTLSSLRQAPASQAVYSVTRQPASHSYNANGARHQRGREEIAVLMSDSEALPPVSPTTPSDTMPAPVAAEIRRLTHDLSNALEILVQTSYLLTLAELKEPASEWLRMLEGGVTRAIDLNAQLRNFVRDHSPR